MRLNVNTGPFRFENGVFHPSGAWEWSGERSNPRADRGQDVYSALVLVGLETQAGEAFPEQDIVDFVTEMRLAQAGDPGASFILQRGVYRHKKTERIADERSLRVIILHLTDETREDFKENILRMAEELAREFEQEEIIVEFQNRGVTDRVIGVTP